MNRKLVSKSNLVLRKILNKAENIDIFQDIIESILKIKINKIKIRPYLKKIENNLPSEENFGVVDVNVLLDTEEEINIGLQIVDGFFIQNKILLYYVQIHMKQDKYDNSNKINRTVTINVIDYDFLNSLKYHNVLILKQKTNDENNLEINKELNTIEMHTIELPKFRKYKTLIETKEDAWIAYLDGTNPNLIKKAIDKYEKINKLDKLLNQYWENEIME